MDNKDLFWWLLVGFPFFGSILSIILSAYFWDLKLLTGGIVLLLFSIMLFKGFERYEKKQERMK